MIFKFLLFAAFVCSSMCYVYQYAPGAAKSDREGYCAFGTEKVYIKIGETKIVSNCEEASCNDDYSMSVYGCGIKVIDVPGCKIVKNMALPYPRCCGDIVCDKTVKVNSLEGNSIE